MLVIPDHYFQIFLFTELYPPLARAVLDSLSYTLQSFKPATLRKSQAMTNDNAIVRLLYAILSQKCLKDVSIPPLSNHPNALKFFLKKKKTIQIDWNKVASDPVLQQEITNGHAARMRYSRFKKQIEGTASPRKPRNPNSPRKTKVEKNKSPKKVKRSDKDDPEKIKEEVGVAGSSHHTPVEGTPEAGTQPDSLHCSSVEGSPFVKREPGSSNGSRYASTPLESSPTPGSSFNEGAGEMSDMGDMLTSFTENGYEPMMGQGIMAHQQYGMGMHTSIGMGDSFHGFWDPQQHVQAEGGVLVKREPRWEQTYRQI